jgi:hypothetical protein
MVTLGRVMSNVVYCTVRTATACRGAPLLAAFASLALTACAVDDRASASGGETRRAAPAHVLSPLLALPGARLVPATERTGAPLPRAGPAPMTPFVHPVAAATLGNDLYIADSGAGKVFRFDFTLNVMAAVQSAPAALGTRLAIGSDYSLYVLDQPRRRVLKLGRNGQLLATYADSVDLNRPTAVVVDDARGQVLVADALYHHLVAFHPLGGGAHVIPLRGDERNRVMNITAMTMGRDAIHISDASCRCVAVVARDGSVRATYGHHEIGQPGAIAIDRHERVYVADVFDGSIKVFAAGRLIDAVPAAVLGVREVSDLSVRESRLVVTDGAGARVVVMRITPPRQGE